MIMPLEARHLEPAVNLHLAVFPDDFITGLGQQFLIRIFYPWFLEHPAGFGYAWEESGKLLGYVVGTENVHAFYGSLFRRKFPTIGLMAGAALLRRPWRLGRFIQVAGALRKGEELPFAADLSYIAVSPEAQSRGIGKRLVEALLDHLRHAGAEGCFVKTRKDISASNRLYLAMGYSPWKEVEMNGAVHCIYVHRLR